MDFELMCTGLSRHDRCVLDFNKTRLMCTGLSRHDRCVLDFQDTTDVYWTLTRCNRCTHVYQPHSQAIPTSSTWSLTVCKYGAESFPSVFHTV